MALIWRWYGDDMALGVYLRDIEGAFNLFYL
jgi:hypothetical protein